MKTQNLMVGISIILLGALSIQPLDLAAQSDQDRERRTRLSFLMLMARPGWGSADDFKTALVQAGLDASPDPRSHSEPGGREFEIGYEHPSAWGVSVSAGRADFGWVHGSRATSKTGEERQNFIFHHSVRHISPVVTYRLGPFRTSLGPSFVQNRILADTFQPSQPRSSEEQEAMTIGLEASVGVSTELLLPFLQLGARVRYRLVSSQEVGPFQAYDGVVPRFKVGLSHWQVGVGLGLRVDRTKTPSAPVSTVARAPESVASLGRLAGKEAAGSRGTWGYSVPSFLGGLPLGIWGPFAFSQEDCRALALSGVAIAGLTSGVALLLSNRLPETEARAIQGEPPAYQDAFRASYKDELQRRRLRRIFRGTLTGALAGVGLLLLLLPAT